MGLCLRQCCCKPCNFQAGLYDDCLQSLDLGTVGSLGYHACFFFVLGGLEAPRVVEGSLVILVYGLSQCTCLGNYGSNQIALNLLPLFVLPGSFLFCLGVHHCSRTRSRIASPGGCLLLLGLGFRKCRSLRSLGSLLCSLNLQHGCNLPGYARNGFGFPLPLPPMQKPLALRHPCGERQKWSCGWPMLAREADVIPVLSYQNPAASEQLLRE